MIGIILVILGLSYIELLGQLVNNSAVVFHNEIEFVIQGIHEKFTKSGGCSQWGTDSRDSSGQWLPSLRRVLRERRLL